MSTSTRIALANRLSEVGFSEIVKIRNKILEMRSRGEDVIQFEGGEPFPDTPAFIKEACIRALSDNKTRYAPSSGIAPLVTAITRKLVEKNGIPATERDVIVVAGGMHALFDAFQAVLNPGDEVLMFSPYWTPIRDLVAMSGGSPVLIETQFARIEGLSQALEAKVTSKTRALYLNSPQNPTGVVFSRSEMLEVAQIAARHDLVVISDEAYEDIIFDEPHVSFASLPEMYERTISCFTFSKSFAMTGWRLGYAVGPEPFASGMKKLTLNSTNGVSTPTQWAGLAALTTPSEFIVANQREYRLRRDLLVGGLNELGLKLELPAGAFYAFADASALGTDSWQISSMLLETARVACLPGVIFGPQGEGCLRFSFSTSVETIERGLEALSLALGN